MSITVLEVSSAKQLKQFVDFPNILYKGNPYFVPSLFSDELKLFTPGKNPALDFCKFQCFLAYEGDKIVGRVAAILNPVANRTWGKETVRFGCIDFIDDINVSSALLKAVEDWGRERGCAEIEGPLGFTDFDPEGMLVEGFDQLATMIGIYNHPYYMEHMEKLGYKKNTDWKEYKISIPNDRIEKYERAASLISERYNLRVKKYKRHELINSVGYKVFDLVNEAYAHLYGYSHLNRDQISDYVKSYLSIIDLDLVSVVVDDKENVVAFGVTMPSLSRALQKCGGRIFPFGWYHLLKVLIFKMTDTVDFLLIGVKKEYKHKGVTALLFNDLLPKIQKYGFKYAETNPELECNNNVQNLWGDLEHEQHKRRRIYGKSL